jgi:hypothetical protein
LAHAVQHKRLPIDLGIPIERIANLFDEGIEPGGRAAR